MRILRRALHPTMPIRRAKAVFSNPNIGGRIFIEAKSEQDVKATIHGVTGVWSRSIASIPQYLYPRLLSVYGKPQPEKGEWVILRKSKEIPNAYDGAFAWILDKRQGDESEGRFSVVAVHRWERETIKTWKVAGTDAGDGEYVAPFTVLDVVREVTPSPYTQAELREAEEQGELMGRIPLDSGEDWKIFKHKDEYITSDGFICFWMISRTSFTHYFCLLPDRDTIDHFREAKFLASPGTKILLDRHQQPEMKSGDRVYISDGTFRSKVGTITNIIDTVVSVYIDSIDATVELALQWLRLHFVILDTVRVQEGEYSGHWGWIVAMKEGSVQLFVQEMGTEVRCSMTVEQGRLLT